MSLLYLQEAGLVDQRAGENEQELWSSVETRGLHRGSVGRAASRSCSLGQETREKGIIGHISAFWLVFILASEGSNSLLNA